MSHKADKLRGKLGSYAKEREQFEMKKKELEAEMNQGKQNMGKIRKGLRGNEINIDQPLAVTINAEMSASTDFSEHGGPDSIKKQPSKMKKVPSKSNLNADVTKTPVPSCAMLSEWVFTGTIESTPPSYKTQEMYETVRLLGRGSFGTVDLVKNVEDNRL